MTNFHLHPSPLASADPPLPQPPNGLSFITNVQAAVSAIENRLSPHTPPPQPLPLEHHNHSSLHHQPHNNSQAINHNLNNHSSANTTPQPQTPSTIAPLNGVPIPSIANILEQLQLSQTPHPSNSHQLPPSAPPISPIVHHFEAAHNSHIIHSTQTVRPTLSHSAPIAPVVKNLQNSLSALPTSTSSAPRDFPITHHAQHAHTIHDQTDTTAEMLHHQNPSNTTSDEHTVPAAVHAAPLVAPCPITNPIEPLHSNVPAPISHFAAKQIPEMHHIQLSSATAAANSHTAITRNASSRVFTDKNLRNVPPISTQSSNLQISSTNHFRSERKSEPVDVLSKSLDVDADALDITDDSVALAIKKLHIFSNGVKPQANKSNRQPQLLPKSSASECVQAAAAAHSNTCQKSSLYRDREGGEEPSMLSQTDPESPLAVCMKTASVKDKEHHRDVGQMILSSAKVQVSEVGADHKENSSEAEKHTVTSRGVSKENHATDQERDSGSRALASAPSHAHSKKKKGSSSSHMPCIVLTENAHKAEHRHNTTAISTSSAQDLLAQKSETQIIEDMKHDQHVLSESISVSSTTGSTSDSMHEPKRTTLTYSVDESTVLNGNIDPHVLDKEPLSARARKAAEKLGSVTEPNPPEAIKHNSSERGIGIETATANDSSSALSEKTISLSATEAESLLSSQVSEFNVVECDVTQETSSACFENDITSRSAIQQAISRNPQGGTKGKSSNARLRNGLSVLNGPKTLSPLRNGSSVSNARKTPSARPRPRPQSARAGQGRDSHFTEPKRNSLRTQTTSPKGLTPLREHALKGSPAQSKRLSSRTLKTTQNVSPTGKLVKLPRVAELVKPRSQDRTSTPLGGRISRGSTFHGVVTQNKQSATRRGDASQVSGRFSSPVIPNKNPAGNAPIASDSSSTIHIPIRRTLSFCDNERRKTLSPTSIRGLFDTAKLQAIRGPIDGQARRRATMSEGGRPPRRPITNPKPFQLTGAQLQAKARKRFEEQNRLRDEIERRRRILRARPMPNFSNPSPKPHF